MVMVDTYLQALLTVTFTVAVVLILWMQLLKLFETVTVAHLKHGTTMLIPTSMTATSDELEAFVKTYLQFINTERKGAKTLGLHFEGPYLSGAGAKSRGAQRGDLLRFPDMDEVKKLYELADGHIVRWDAAPELPGSLN